MDNLMTIAFEAHNTELNHHRRYQLTLGRDLLDDWTLAISYGRSGQSGQVKQFASPDAEEVRAVIRDRLCRRLSAPKRIGCAYRLTALDSASGIDAADWLPGEVMARFFAQQVDAPDRFVDEMGRADADRFIRRRNCGENPLRSETLAIAPRSDHVEGSQ